MLYVVDTDVVTFRRISPRKLKLKDGDNQEKLGRKKKEYDVDDSEDDLSAATAMDAGLSTPTRRSKRRWLSPESCTFAMMLLFISYISISKVPRPRVKPSSKVCFMLHFVVLLPVD